MRFRPIGYLAIAAALACAPATTEPPLPAIAFIGDSITEQLGDLSQWFGSDAVTWVNAGVGGETTWQVLARVQTIDPHATPTCVVLVGINDLYNTAGDGGAVEDLTPPGTAANGFTSVGGYLAQIADSLRAMHIQPVLATLLPVGREWGPQADIFNPKIVVVNTWIRQYAAAHGIPLIDYYPAFVAPDGYGQSALFTEGLHPNDAGRRIETALARAVLQQIGAMR